MKIEVERLSVERTGPAGPWRLELTAWVADDWRKLSLADRISWAQEAVRAFMEGPQPEDIFAVDGEVIERVRDTDVSAWKPIPEGL